jgi:hypothetical protein
MRHGPEHIASFLLKIVFDRVSLGRKESIVLAQGELSAAKDGMADSKCCKRGPE